MLYINQRQIHCDASICTYKNCNADYSRLDVYFELIDIENGIDEFLFKQQLIQR